MLKLVGIKKDYKIADGVVPALKGIDISFRNTEFVSILGPSGCGKTTLLNIIGGLDHYTSGDLFIDNVSTKKFSDRDWDTYRNHRVGFVFQNYNLIPHQTVLENVELALTISGIDKKERIKRAKEALEKVGLIDQCDKKPNQLSGGQCQRVAIARAIVNNPDILLADEPTGALDSVTSVQIMDLIKKIAKECLVIMVTHNPELAEQYSSRIVKLKDGLITYDSNPFDEEKEKLKIIKNKKDDTKKSKLSFWSAFKLSFRNLWSKFRRTLMVCFAGSIGIIGISTVLALSFGIRGYIDSMQNDMLSGNPITISESTLDFSSIIEQMDEATKESAIKANIEDGYVNVNGLIKYLVQRSDSLSSMYVQNNISQEYLDYLSEMPKEYYAATNYDYGLNVANNIYTDYYFMTETGEEKVRLSLSAALQIYTSMLGKTEFSDYAALVSQYATAFKQAPDNNDFILSQYNVLTEGDSFKMPTKADEIILVVNDEQELADLMLAQYGYYSQAQFLNLIYKATGNEKYDAQLDKNKFSYQELLGKEFVYYPNDTIYNEVTQAPFNQLTPFTYNAYASEDWTNGMKLKITSILIKKENISYGSLSTGFYYTKEFTNKILNDSKNSQVVNYLKNNNMSAYKVSIGEDESGSIIIVPNSKSKAITYQYSFYLDGENYQNITGIVGSVSTESMLARYAASLLPDSDGTTSIDYQLTLRELGGVTHPNNISIYSWDFEQKDKVVEYLDKWNSSENLTINGKTITADNRSEIIYSDTLSLVIALINGVISMITYALVAFTSLSLVVSTVMIAIITYVSVVERIKEIGVIRSLGGRKRDVSALFIAETFIIGTISGVIGVGITYLLSLIINLIVSKNTGIATIASLPISTALIMIAISIILTLISGLVPARSAAKKDPVIALRTE